MAVRLGTNPIAWSNDDMRTLGGQIPLETCLAEARAAGFEGIELGHKFPREAKALRQVLSTHGLALISGWYSAHLRVRSAEAELAAMRPHLDLLKALDTDIVIVAETSSAIHGDPAMPLSRRPVLAEGDWAEFGRRLTALGDAVAAEHMTLAYHHHMGTVVQSPRDIDALMASTGPSVRLLLDTGHAVFAGADPPALAERFAPRIAHIHCKDVRKNMLDQALASDSSFLDAVCAGVFTVPGDGHIDFPAILRALGSYSGWLVVEAEQDPDKAPPADYAALGYRNLAAFAEEAGFARL